MIINFDKRNNGGGGGVSDYTQLTSKPQINGHELIGNKTSQELGITSEALEPVATVPSGASVGDVYAISTSNQIGYGWEATSTGYIFNCSLNPASGTSEVMLGQFVGVNTGATIYMYPESDSNPGHISFGETTVNRGFNNIVTFETENDLRVNYFDYDKVEFIFTGTPPELEIASRILPFVETVINNQTVQVEDTNGKLGHFNFVGQYQDRYNEVQFWISERGKKDFTPNTELALIHYYQNYFKLFTNSEGNFCIDYSTDSAATWNHYLENAKYVTPTPAWYPIDITDPNGKNILFKAWMAAGDGNYGIKMQGNKSMWIDSCDDPYGVVTKSMIKDKYSLPVATDSSLGGIKVGSGLSIDSTGTLSVSGGTGGGMSAHWFNYSDGNFTLVREDCTNDGDYLCHFGPEIEGSRSFKGLQCVNGEIDTTYTGWGMNHVGNGHMVGSTVDANGVTYWAHAWSESGKLYWELNTPVMDLDAYGTGSNKEGGLVY